MQGHANLEPITVPRLTLLAAVAALSFNMQTASAQQTGPRDAVREKEVHFSSGRAPAHGGQEPAPGYVELVLQWLRRQAQRSAPP
ncbi:MAG TPA: hypothetical protein VMM17_09025 [Gemmatimonadaceae bacterium]|nr:hypothetical protein [Gemmatimonadaceae bacterium]